MVIKKFLIRFTKKDRARYLSHHELMTLIERACRRANLPLKFSEGFNPKPRISFPTALALGIKSEDEVFYLELTNWVAPAEITRRLQEQLIPGVIITQTRPIHSRRLPQVVGAEYLIKGLKLTINPREILEKSEIVFERINPEKGTFKNINIRPYLKDIKQSDNGVSISLKITPEGTIRIQELLKILGIPEGSYSICKLRTELDYEP